MTREDMLYLEKVIGNIIENKLQAERDLTRKMIREEIVSEGEKMYRIIYKGFDQTNKRFDQVDERFLQTDKKIDEGNEQIVDMLTNTATEVIKEHKNLEKRVEVLEDIVGVTRSPKN